MDERDLSPLQRKWLDASMKIGRGAMTKTERLSLEKLYAEMLPAEQQELYRFIQEKFGKKESHGNDPEGEDRDLPDDPISFMESRVWAEPSDALKKAFSRSLAPKRRPPGLDD